MGNVGAAQLSEINECAFNDLQYTDFVGHTTNCQDDPGAHYMGLWGDHEFAVSYCDDLQIAEEPCADKMRAILDELDERE